MRRRDGQVLSQSRPEAAPRGRIVRAVQVSADGWVEDADGDLGWHQVERKVVPAQVRAKRDRAEGDLALGGPEPAATVLRDGLVGEHWISVHPVLVGAGCRPRGTARRIARGAGP